MDKQIAHVETKMLNQPQAQCPVYHRFENGHYIRELHMKAGTLAIGHYQNFPHLNIFLKGKVLMVNDNGDAMLLEAPMTFVAQPGRKVGYVVEDMIWQNVYVTDITDVDVLETMYLTKSDAFLQHNAHMFALAAEKAIDDRDDYKLLISEMNLTEDAVKAQVENIEDMIALPPVDYKAALALSPIEGTGTFATAPIEQGEVIGPSRLGPFRTVFGRYVNHSKTPNAEMVINGSDIWLVAIRDIAGAAGGMPGEEITTDYRSTIKLLHAAKQEEK